MSLPSDTDRTLTGTGPLSLASRRQVLLGTAAAGAVAMFGGARVFAQGGGIVVYSTTHPAVQARLNEAFTAKTGIAVQSMRLNTSALAQRFLAEQGVSARTYLKTGDDMQFIDTLDPSWSGALPGSFLYDSSGRLVRFWEGKASADTLRARILPVLEGPARS